MYVRELVLAYRARPSPIGIDSSQRLSAPREAAAVLTALLSHEAIEVFAIVCLSTKHHLQAYYEVSRGSLDATLVHPRDVFKAAIMANAAALIMAHNHPSGDPTPSPDDLLITRKLVQAGEVLGVDVVDHIIVGHDGKYYSFKETGGL